MMKKCFVDYLTSSIYAEKAKLSYGRMILRQNNCEIILRRRPQPGRAETKKKNPSAELTESPEKGFQNFILSLTL